MKKLNALILPEKIMLTLLMVISIAYGILSYAGYVKSSNFSKRIRDISAQAHLQYKMQQQNMQQVNIQQQNMQQQNIQQINMQQVNQPYTIQQSNQR